MVADKNSNLITLVTKVMLLWLYRGIFRTLAQSEKFIQTYSGIFIRSGTFRNIQLCSGILRDINVYSGIFSRYWGVWSHNQTLNSLFNHFQRYLDIFRNIDAYSATLTGAQQRRKKFPDFGKKGPDCVFDEMFSVLVPQTLPVSLKNFWLGTSVQTFFLQNALS